MMDHLLQRIAEGIDLTGIAIILWGTVAALVQLLKLQIMGSSAKDFLDQASMLRCRLGTYFLLGLEFMIASDVIMTVISPTRDELLVVALLVAIRTAIGHFLGKELQEVRRRGEA